MSMLYAHRFAALGPRPPWWRPFARRRWQRAIEDLSRQMGAEIVADAMRAAFAELGVAVGAAMPAWRREMN